MSTSKTVSSTIHDHYANIRREINFKINVQKGNEAYLVFLTLTLTKRKHLTFTRTKLASKVKTQRARQTKGLLAGRNMLQSLQRYHHIFVFSSLVFVEPSTNQTPPPVSTCHFSSMCNSHTRPKSSKEVEALVFFLSRCFNVTCPASTKHASHVFKHSLRLARVVHFGESSRGN